MSCKHQFIGAFKVLAFLVIPVVTALWGLGFGKIQYEKDLQTLCRAGAPFTIEGEKVICLNREGLTNMLEGYAAELKKKGRTPL